MRPHHSAVPAITSLILVAIPMTHIARGVFWFLVSGSLAAAFGPSSSVIAGEPTLVDPSAANASAEPLSPFRTASSLTNLVDSCDSCNDCTACDANCALVDPYCRIFSQDRWFRVRGWVDAGILGNTSSLPSHFSGPNYAVQRNDGQFNQMYLIVDRVLPTDGSFGIGGRLDVLYGSEQFLAQSNGLERTQAGNPHWNSNPNIGLALPQSYAELGTKDTSVKVGHFYSIVDLEGVQLWLVDRWR